MQAASLILFWISYAGFVGASVVFGYQILRKRQLASLPQIITLVALIALSASIGLNSAAKGGTPLTGANQLVLAAWALAVLYFVVEYLLKFKQYGGLIIPVVVVLMTIAQIIGGPRDIAPVPENLSRQMESIGIGFHVALIVFANMLFLIGAIASACYLYQNRQLKAHATGLLSRRLPSLANLERLASRSITIALPVYFAGQFLGIIRAINVDAAGWWADPRVMLSGVILLVFIVFMVLYLRNKVSGVTTSRIAVVGGILVIVLMVLARTVPAGFHVFGVIG